MTGRITDILRYPIKSHGREAVARVTLSPGQSLPWDRHWAVAHDATDADGTEWLPCRNFTRGAKVPGLQAMTAALDEATATVTLTHPELGEVRFRPDVEGATLIDWTRSLMPEGRAASDRVVRAEARAMTDSDFASVSLCNRSSHRAVSQKLGRDLSIHRWRGNLWFDGLAPWEEFDWIGREVRIGSAVVMVRERTTRCLMTHANPETGARDADILGTLDTWGHRDFSVMAEVIQGGEIAAGDEIGPA
ncbi:MOSC domain-containing protein [Marinovum sp.]|uniref:MOSC domain-containing protein n=1 Tax=Marinovum sp. TaxID=2024839 RepID=UPI002B274CA2|nr:MOSC domain-containing protein [Marinovum sp.]